eukprot:11259841-Alexandrium_andersonii.AAC.1
MISRVALVAWLLLARGCWVMIEQPRGSLMQRHPRVQDLASRFELLRLSLNMKAYGAASSKGTW